MSLFDNQSCPVCKRPFEEGDDIVVCPECGTPHHRECYRLTGHCVNRGLHQANYNYSEEHQPQTDKKLQETANQAKQENIPPLFPPAPGESFNPGSDFTKTPYDAQSLCGENAGDIAAAVRTNVNRFMKVFTQMEAYGTKASWNWGAFIFGVYYLFYRKLYKQAVTLLCINLTLSSVVTLLSAKLAPLTAAAMEGLQKLASDGNADAFAAQVNEMYGLADFRRFTAVYLAYIAVTVMIRILVAIFTDSVYKSAVSDLVKNVNRQFKDGAALAPQPFGREEEFNFTEEQLRRLYLAKRGGVSIWAPCAAYLLMYFISVII